MGLFESTLVLLAVAVVLLHAARGLGVPYPPMLALAGGCVAALPWAPQVAIEPHLALALFVAPAVLDSAFDLPPRELIRNWLPLTSLAVLLVLVTTASVAWLGWQVAGLPLAAAVTLGAIVAPPDAAAAGAMLRQFDLPRRTMVVLKGESLLNDAVVLLIFSAAVTAAAAPPDDWAGSIPQLAIAVPGGALFGALAGALQLYAARKMAGTLASIILQFTATFGTWVLADRLQLSPIAAVVTLAMIIAHHLPARTRARDRINANAVWASVVFVLNVLAFLLMGLQARVIVAGLSGEALWHAVGFGIAVLALVMFVRVAWVMTYGVLVRRFEIPLRRHAPEVPIPSKRIGLLISWCGMRGLLTLAASFALPADFPKRDLVVLTAYIVVLGTLVLQGFTLRALISVLGIRPDQGFAAQVRATRTAMLSAAIEALADRDDAVATVVRGEYESERRQVNAVSDPQRQTDHDGLRATALEAQRRLLHDWRRAGRIDDDLFHRLEQELDFAELHAGHPDDANPHEA